jgi:hypothetical protein
MPTNNDKHRCGWVKRSEQDEVVIALSNGSDIEETVVWVKAHEDDSGCIVARVRWEVV